MHPYQHTIDGRAEAAIDWLYTSNTILAHTAPVWMPEVVTWADTAKEAT